MIAVVENMSKTKEAQKPYRCWSWIICLLCIGWIGLAVFIGIGTIFGNSWTSVTEEVIEAQWTQWSPCSSDLQTRSRTLDDGCLLNCISETEECIPQGWSTWSRCSNECGDGYQLRQWQCGSDLGLHCNASMQVLEKQDCTSEELCHVQCSQSLMGDGFCDEFLNIAKCNFDDGDCCLQTVDRTFCTDCLCYQSPSVDNDTCPFTQFVGNGYCEDFANTWECAFEGGDCCGASDYSYCAECQCKFDEYQVLAQRQPNLKCPLLSHAIGDGFCNDETNNEECSWDGGDCCQRVTLVNVCQDCQCLQPNKTFSILQQNAKCPTNLQGFLNNGKCDDIANTAQCQYDMGECCGNGDAGNCRDPRQIKTGRGAILEVEESCEYWYLKGNGFCDDAANTKVCNWDDGDCCGQPLSKGLCEECQCKSSSGISQNNDQSQDQVACSRATMYDGICDQANNVPGCLHDGFDCCLTASGALSSESCPDFATCHMDKLEDGSCQSHNNKSQCLYDLGVCLTMSSISSIECSTALYSDSTCDLVNFHASCDYDGGDCLSSNINGEVMFVGTGFNKRPLSDFKGYLPDGSFARWIPNLPIDLQNAMLFHASNAQLFLCGGINTNGINVKSCYRYTYQAENYQLWKVWRPLLDFRLDSAHGIMFKNLEGGSKEEFLWVTGGITSAGAVTDQTEMITVYRDNQMVETSSWAIGDSLKYALAGHCIAQLADDVALIAGGYSFDLIATSQSLMYNASVQKPNDPWTDLSSMNIARKNHLCSKYDLNGLVTVLAVGGTDSNDDMLETVEIFYMVNRLWSVLTKVLPRTISSAALVRNMNNRLHLLGGVLDTIPQSIVWVYHSTTGWRRSSIAIEHALQDHVAFSAKISDITFKHHPMVLVVGGQLQDDSKAPVEMFCTIQEPSFGLVDFCDIDVSQTFVYMIDQGLGPLLNPILWQDNEDYIACGGVLSHNVFDTVQFGSYSTQCQKFNGLQWRLLPEPLLSDVRNASAFSFHQSKESGWITGGFKYVRFGGENVLRPLKSTEKVNGMNIEQGVDLPFALAGHCSVHIGGDIFFFAGGFKHDSKVASKDTFIQDWQTGHFKMMPPMIHKRGYHTCFTMEMEQDLMVVAIGGGTHKVETYSFRENSWKESEDFCDDKNGQCYQYLGARAVVSPDSVLLFGSLQDSADGQTASYIFLFQCSTGRREDCQLEKVDYELKYARMHYSVLTVNMDVQDHSEHISSNSLLDLNLLKSNTDVIKNETRLLTLFGDTFIDMSLFNNSVKPWHSESITPFSVRHGYGYVDGRYLILIGGNKGQTTYKKYLDEPYVPVDLMKPMPIAHKGGASVLMRGQDFWILGGKDGSNSNTNQTHYIRKGNWYHGPQIDYKATGFCAVNYVDKYAIVLGGIDEFDNPLMRVHAFNLYPGEEGEVQDFRLPSMRETRSSMACLTYDHEENLRIIVAGGLTEVGTLTNSVEVYLHEKKEWVMMENLPRLSALGNLLLDDERLYYFGGMADDRGGDGNIYYMDNLLRWENISTQVNESTLTPRVDLNGTEVYYDENGDPWTYLDYVDYGPSGIANGTLNVNTNNTINTNSTVNATLTEPIPDGPEFWTHWGEVTDHGLDMKYHQKAIILPYITYYIDAAEI